MKKKKQVCAVCGLTNGTHKLSCPEVKNIRPTVRMVETSDYKLVPKR